jgi:hypothetical protein
VLCRTHGVRFAQRGPYVSHSYGVTRRHLDARQKNTTAMSSILDYVAERLSSEYGVDATSEG